MMEREVAGLELKEGNLISTMVRREVLEMGRAMEQGRKKGMVMG